MVSFENFSSFLLHRYAFDEEGNPIEDKKENHKKAAKDWLNWPGRRTFLAVVFEPSPTCQPSTTELPTGREYNLWMGFAIRTKAGECQKILNHIFVVWCCGNQAFYDYILRWLAYMIQHPDRMAETAIVLKSGQGTGKNILVDMIRRYFGLHGIMVTNPDHVFGRFNGHLALCVFVHLNEAVWGNDKKQEGVLKALITDESQLLEKKYMDAIPVKNCKHLLITSNNAWCAPLDLDDRRFFVLDISEEKKGDFNYFKALNQEIENGGDAAFFHYLMNLEFPDLIRGNSLEVSRQNLI